MCCKFEEIYKIVVFTERQRRKRFNIQGERKTGEREVPHTEREKDGGGRGSTHRMRESQGGRGSTHRVRERQRGRGSKYKVRDRQRKERLHTQNDGKTGEGEVPHTG